MTAQQTKWLYWGCNVVLIGTIGVGGVMNVLMGPQVTEGLQHLGYPHYFGPMLGVYKLLGMGVLLANRPARLKEWAYAGMTFDVMSAIYSHFSSGDSIGFIVAPMGVLAAVLGSYFCWHKMGGAKPAVGHGHSRKAKAA